MALDKKSQLADVLRRLNSGEDPKKVRKEAKELVSSLSASELSMAEQELVNDGVPAEHLRGLCSVHMEMLDSGLQRLRQRLPEGHVLATLIAEHERILGFLDQLDDLNRKVQADTDYDDFDLAVLADLADKLLGAEPHHQREEQVLFPEMESRGVSGPTRIMRMEHEDLRSMKRQVRGLALLGRGRNIAFVDFQRMLGDVAPKLVFGLRDHIFKENNVLYPTALDVLNSPVLWQEMRNRCDTIGYCWR